MGALRRLYLPTFLVAIAAAWLAWRGWTGRSGFGPLRAIRSEQLELAGPAVVGFVLVVFTLEQVRPAERHQVLARGHVLDLFLTQWAEPFTTSEVAEQ